MQHSDSEHKQKQHQANAQHSPNTNSENFKTPTHF
jgi:hypothetical protein